MDDLTTPSQSAAPAPFDPEIKSLLTSFLMTLTTFLATSAAGVGVITKDQESQFSAILVSVFMWLITLGVWWYKKHQSSPRVQIANINHMDNGLKVVPKAVPESIAPTVTAPLKGQSAP